MQLTCPSCSARYVMNPQLLGAEGRNVRCAKCSNTWYAMPPPEEPVPVPPAEDTAFPPPPDDFAAHLNNELKNPANPQFSGSQASERRIQLPGFVRMGKPQEKLFWMVGAAIIGLILIGLLLVLAFPKSNHPPIPASAAEIYKGKGLNFADVKAIESGPSTARSLKVSGTIINATTKPIALPALSVKLTARDNGPTIEWVFHMPQDVLAPGESIQFETGKDDLKFSGSEIKLSFISGNE